MQKQIKTQIIIIIIIPDKTIPCFWGRKTQNLKKRGRQPVYAFTGKRV